MFTTVVLEEAISVVSECFKIFTVTASQLWSQFVPDCHDYWKKKNKSVEKFTKKTLCVGICVCGNIMTTLTMCGQNVCAICLNSFTFLCSNLIEQKD